MAKRRNCFSFGEGEERFEIYYLWCSKCVPTKFSTYSQHVPFPKLLMFSPRNQYHNILSHNLCPKLNSHNLYYMGQEKRFYNFRPVLCRTRSDLELKHTSDFLFLKNQELLGLELDSRFNQIKGNSLNCSWGSFKRNNGSGGSLEKWEPYNTGAHFYSMECAKQCCVITWIYTKKKPSVLII